MVTCIQKQKKIAIKCQFDYTYHFNGNIAKVLNRGNINYMTLNGYLIQPYESFRGNLGFRKGIVPAKASRELNGLSAEILCGYIIQNPKRFLKYLLNTIECMNLLKDLQLLIKVINGV